MFLQDIIIVVTLLRQSSLRNSTRSHSRRNPCTDARPTKTCVAPVDASRNFYCFLRMRSVGGGGGVGMLPDFLSCFLFSVQQTTSGIGHRVK